MFSMWCLPGAKTIVPPRRGCCCVRHAEKQTRMGTIPNASGELPSYVSGVRINDAVSKQGEQTYATRTCPAPRALITDSPSSSNDVLPHRCVDSNKLKETSVNAQTLCLRRSEATTGKVLDNKCSVFDKALSTDL